MKTAQQNGTILAFAFVAALIAFGAPTLSHAEQSSQTASVQTRQILPPNGTGCTALSVTNVTPYVYGGILNSFDVTVNNSSYVALVGTVGGESVGFQYMTRRITPDGQLKIHMDVPVGLGKSGAVSITMLSSQGGITCASTVSFGIAGLSNDTITNTPGGPTQGGGGVMPGTNTGTGTGKTPTGPKATSSTTTVTGTEPDGTTTFASALNRACEATGALQLWFVLIAAFIIICALTALNEAYLATRSQYLPGALILAPFAILLLFWLIASACRGSYWVPIMLFVVAAAGLLASYRNHKAIAKIIELPPAKSSK